MLFIAISKPLKYMKLYVGIHYITFPKGGTPHDMYKI